MVAVWNRYGSVLDDWLLDDADFSISWNTNHPLSKKHCIHH